ncbi:MAG: hypothetical protein JWM10_3673, partial [Myxococcaceae bacterium]|nr:hypothetical protein [Myxococcaceae bacterium]
IERASERADEGRRETERAAGRALERGGRRLQQSSDERRDAR